MAKEQVDDFAQMPLWGWSIWLHECPRQGAGDCLELFEGEGYDPGHNYGCGWVRTAPGRSVRADDCHPKWCTKQCYENWESSQEG
jgi:hypothetical protein